MNCKERRFLKRPSLVFPRQRCRLQFDLLSPCAPRGVTISVPPPMRFSLRNCIALSACVSLVLICSCEKHVVGEMPEVQKERAEVAPHSEAGGGSPASPTPTAKPTPAEFFPTQP